MSNKIVNKTFLEEAKDKGKITLYHVIRNNTFEGSELLSSSAYFSKHGSEPDRPADWDESADREGISFFPTLEEAQEFCAEYDGKIILRLEINEIYTIGHFDLNSEGYIYYPYEKLSKHDGANITRL